MRPEDHSKAALQSCKSDFRCVCEASVVTSFSSTRIKNSNRPEPEPERLHENSERLVCCVSCGVLSAAGSCDVCLSGVNLQKSRTQKSRTLGQLGNVSRQMEVPLMVTFVRVSFVLQTGFSIRLLNALQAAKEKYKEAQKHVFGEDGSVKTDSQTNQQAKRLPRKFLKNCCQDPVQIDSDEDDPPADPHEEADDKLVDLLLKQRAFVSPLSQNVFQQQSCYCFLKFSCFLV